MTDAAARQDQAITPTIIEPTRGVRFADLAELWRFRELVYFLTWRDIKVRYKQTLLGGAWAILKPLIAALIFTIIFGRLAKLPTDEVSPAVFYFTGLVPWMFFQDGISKASNSLVVSRNMVTKIYFPRLAAPMGSILAGLLDFALAFVVLIGMVVLTGTRLSASIWTLPLFVLLAFVTALGVGLWLAALNVSYRDIAYVTPFLLQAWLYASPVAYSATLIPEGIWRVVYGLNPMAGVVQGFRWALLGAGAPPSGLVLASTGVALLLLISGLLYFRNTERTFADVV